MCVPIILVSSYLREKKKDVCDIRKVEKVYAGTSSGSGRKDTKIEVVCLLPRCYARGRRDGNQE